MFLIFNLISDLLIINLSVVLAYVLKFKIMFSMESLLEYGNFVSHAQIEPYLDVLYIISIIWVIFLMYFKVYRRRSGVLSSIEEFFSVIKAGLISTILFMALTFVFSSFPGSRFVLLYAFIISVFWISLSHQAWFYLFHRYIKRRDDYKQVLVIGTSEVAQSIYEKLLHYESHHYSVLGMMGKKPKKLLHSLETTGMYLGDIGDILSVARARGVNEVFVASEALSRKDLSVLTNDLIQMDVQIHIIPSFYDFVSNKIEVNSDLGFPLFSLRTNRLSRIQAYSKRVMDLIIAITLLLPCLIVMAVVAALIKLKNDGPVLFRQERVGQNGRLFEMLKFRTMPVDVESTSGPVINTQKTDSRTNGLGSLLRKTSLDELPQLVNIIRGEMSFVGPRPERLFFVDQFKVEISNYEERLKVLPGLTGWAQINGRSALSDRVDEKLMYDLYYINNWSIILDLKIMLKTGLYALRGQGAY
jgi:exopolysaccharide biosynthesis polyprenyl glycosylphosphotransferase